MLYRAYTTYSSKGDEDMTQTKRRSNKKATTPGVNLSVEMKEAYLLKLKIAALEKEYKGRAETIKEEFEKLNITTLSIDVDVEGAPMILKAEVVATTATSLDRTSLEVFLQSKGTDTTKFLVSKPSSRFELRPVKG
jgi:hypothetical protein